MVSAEWGSAVNCLVYLTHPVYSRLLQYVSVVPGSVQVPENRTHGKKSLRTGPGTARISESVLEPEPEPPKSLGQFQNLNFFGMSAPTLTKKVFFLDVC